MKILLNFGQDWDRDRFIGPDIFVLKFGLYFLKTEINERPKTKTKIFGQTEYPPLPFSKALDR